MGRQGGFIVRRPNGRTALKLRRPVVLSIFNEDEGQVVKSFVPAGAILLVAPNQGVVPGNYLYLLRETYKPVNQYEGRVKRQRVCRVSAERGKIFLDFPVFHSVALTNGTTWVLRRQYYEVENIQILNVNLGDKISDNTAVGYKQILNTLPGKMVFEKRNTPFSLSGWDIGKHQKC